MFTFFDYLISVIISVIAFVISLVGNIVWFFRILGAVIDYLFKAIAFIPPIFSVFAIATVAVCVVLAIVGRNAGGQQ